MIKDEILHILKENQGAFVSGQAVSEQLDVTRAAVWKAIKQLQKDGYGIESVSNHGHKLTACADILTYEEIKELLETRSLGHRIVHFDSIDSTNREAKRLAEQGEPEGTIVVAEMQTGGKGCAGRQWDCQPYQGIWMSIILRPAMDMPAAPCFTQMACAAVGQALEASAEGIQVKWPNDILLHGKKIGGVLTESSGEIDRVDYIVLGIGVNVNQTAADFLPALTEKATSLCLETGQKQSRKQVFCAIVNALEHAYLSDGGVDTVLAYCKSHSATIGRLVTVLDAGAESLGTAIDLDEHGGLVVRMENGRIRHITSGGGLAG
ncbi:biotin--[acetyl-CoA-carboxylase] ligase [Ethanoligenens sp.]|uniref:biotin--[acetyl-CoA-carboxylase] ligase n=1 Tax=Ethanoligenens sp. TaxID=2099655 RepID=UPI0039E8D179